jgi:hypothetical protein
MFRTIVIPVLATVFLSLPAWADPAVWVEGVEVQSVGANTQFVVRTSSPPVFQSYARSNPSVLIVDLLDAEGTPGYVPSPGAPFQSIILSNHNGKNGKPLCRMTFRFSESVQYDVTAFQKTVKISIGKDVGKKLDDGAAKQSNLKGDALRDKKHSAPLAMRNSNKSKRVSSDAAQPRLAQGTGAENEGVAGASTDDGSANDYSEKKMTYIGFRDTSTQSRVFARLDQEVKYEVKKEGDNLMVLEIEESFIPLRNNKNHLDTTFFESPVKMVTPTEVEGYPRKIRIIIEMKDNVPYEHKVEGNEIAIYFKK